MITSNQIISKSFSKYCQMQTNMNKKNFRVQLIFEFQRLLSTMCSFHEVGNFNLKEKKTKIRFIIRSMISNVNEQWELLMSLMLNWLVPNKCVSNEETRFREIAILPQTILLSSLSSSQSKMPLHFFEISTHPPPVKHLNYVHVWMRAKLFEFVRECVCVCVPSSLKRTNKQYQ